MNLSYTIFVDRQMTEVRDVANLEGMAADKAMECIRHALGGRDPQEGEYVADLGIRIDRIEQPVIATGKAYSQATRDWTELATVEFKNRTEAVNWVRFNRDWMKDLRIDGVLA